MAVNAGKARRLRRLVDETGRTVILPLDIVMPVGLFQGAEDTGKLIDMGCAAGVDAVILRWERRNGTRSVSLPALASSSGSAALLGCVTKPRPKCCSTALTRAS